MDFSLTSVKPSINVLCPLVHAHRRFVSSVSCCAARPEPNYYKLLRLSSKSAGVDEVKRAYRRMSLQYHPDVCDPSMKEESTRMFVLVNAAYKTLSDPLLRMHYDYELGLRDSMPAWRTDDTGATKIWENQISGLKRRSDRRMAAQGTTWGSRMRARKAEN